MRNIFQIMCHNIKLTYNAHTYVHDLFHDAYEVVWFLSQLFQYCLNTVRSHMGTFCSTCLIYKPLKPDSFICWNYSSLHASLIQKRWLCSLYSQGTARRLTASLTMPYIIVVSSTLKSYPKLWAAASARLCRRYLFVFVRWSHLLSDPVSVGHWGMVSITMRGRGDTKVQQAFVPIE